MGRVIEPADFNNLVLANRGTYSVKLSDVGYAEDGAEEPRTEARLNGQPAVTLIVAKQSGQNTGQSPMQSKSGCRRFKKPCRPVQNKVVGIISLYQSFD